MRDREWKQYFLYRLNDPDFREYLRSHLEDIRHASPKDRPAAAASFGGTLRACRGMMRIRLAQAMMDQLHIVPTIHVAMLVMRTTFFESATNDTLGRFFMQPRHDAEEKYVDKAREILVCRPDAVERYRNLYRWYCCALERTVKRCKSAGCNSFKLYICELLFLMWSTVDVVPLPI